MQTPSMFESLERRRLLAGNVTVGVTPLGGLAIAGDARSNHVAIFASGTGYSITGTDTAITSSLPIAVPIAGGLSFPGFFPIEIVAAMGNGDDTVTLLGTSDTTDFNIQTGNGNDVVRLANSGFFNRGDMHIDTGKGNDEVRFGVVEFFQTALNINLGKGNDTVAIDGLLILVQSAATIDGSGGSDTVRDGDELALVTSTLDLLHFEISVT